ncbi:hypothetical protein U6B65_09010 [Oscillospiraceae bacterium MB08-C2-2]|nr:hypothetical protein U6B65_09010 [Oscillospiraceae bacterium MB08-C2-2]
MEKTAFRNMMAVYLSALALCTGLRLFLKFQIIDPFSGFYNGGAPAVWIFRGLLVIAIAFFLWNMLRQNTITWYSAFYNDRPMNLTAVLLGFACFLYTTQVVGDILTQREVHPFNKVGNFFLAGLCVLTGIVFFIIGTGGLRANPREPSVFWLIIPVIWQALLLIISFNHTTTLATVSDNVLVLLFLASYNIFLLGHARTMCNVGSLKGRNYAVPMGLSASLLGFAAVIPDTLWLLLTQRPLSSGLFGKWGSLLIFAMSLYALCFTVALRRSVARELG